MFKLSAVMAVAAFSLVACGGKGDECQRFWDKTAPTMAKMDPGKKMPADAKEQFLKQCRDGDKMKSDPVFKCVLDASGEAAINDCMTKAFSDYKNAGRRSEAELNLNRLAKGLKVLHAMDGTFPVGKVGPTPAESCCKHDGAKCPVTEWTDEVWKKLEFSVDQPHQYRYAYESDGNKATALAIGDLDCNEQPATFKLEVSAGADGNVTSTITKPEAGQY